MSGSLFVFSPAIVEAEHEAAHEQVILQLSRIRVHPALEFSCSTRASYLGPIVQDYVGLRVDLVSSHLPYAHRVDHGYLHVIYMH
jgi:hypothetical protein